MDNTAPTVTIDVPAASSAAFRATISFSEAVSGFTETDITAGNGTLSGFTPTTTDTVWMVQVTPAADGPVTLQIGVNVATDAAGNANTAAAPATSTYTAPDTTAPTVTSIERQTPATSPTNADSLTWRVTFSEAVENVDTADFTVSGGSTATVTNVQPVGGETDVYDVTVSGGDLAGYTGTVTLEFAGGQNIQDAAGNRLANTNLAGTDNNYEVDNIAPTVTIDVPAASSAAFPATISFSEAVSGFTEAGITAENGTLSDFTPTTTGTVWTVQVTPAADGQVTLDIGANVATDAAGNANTAATQASSTYAATATDTTAPRVISITRQTPATSPTNGDSLMWRVVFSEAVVNVDNADFEVSGTSATLNVLKATGQTVTWDVTVSGGDLASLDGTVTLSFAADQGIADEADNPLVNTTPTITDDNSYELDNTAPLVEITDVPPMSDGPFTATISFSEVVSGFAQDDITAANGTLSTFEPVTTAGTTPGTVWRVLVTPTADGAVTLDIEANGAQDTAGNGNTAASQAGSTYTARDTTLPHVVSITRQTPATSPTNADSLTWRVVFSETVENVDSTDFVVSGTTATLSVAEVTSQTGAWDVTVSGGDLADKNGTVTLSFAPDQNITDEADNALDNTTPTITDDNSYELNNTAPLVEITDVPPMSDGPFTATISFSEVVSGFAQGDITAANGTLSTFEPVTTAGTTPGTVWTVLVTPTADGAVTLEIEANVAQDMVGNGNMAAVPATSTYTAPDNDAPHVISITQPSPSNRDSLIWRVVFSETVENVDSTDFVVSGTTATLSVAEVTSQTGAWDVTVSGGDLGGKNGAVILAFAPDQNIADEADNALASTSPTLTNYNSYMVDNTPPMVGYTSPNSLTLGTAVTAIEPSTTDTDIASYSATGLPDGLVIDPESGVISGTPITADADPSIVTVTVTDTSGNSTIVRLTFLVDNGDPRPEPEETTETVPKAREEAEAVLKEVVLPDVVQQLTARTTEAITSRLNSIASGAPLGAPLTLNLGDVVADTVAFFHGERERLKNGSLEWRQVVSGRDFAFPLSALTLAQGEGAGGQESSFSSLAIWGGGDYSSYGNIIDGTDVDGNGFSGTIGMDMQPMPQLVTGLALTTSRWGLDYATDGSDGSEEEGTYDVDVTVLNPYLSWLATDQLSLWATFGYGRGEVEQDPEGQDALPPRTDALTSWAGGIRFELLPGVDPLTGEGSPLGLAFKVDGGTSSFLDTQVQLARLAAEVSRSFPGEAGLLTTALDLGWNIRSVSDKDKDDGGGGAELAGSLNWLNTDGSVSATVDTRVLFSGGDHREWGIGGHLRFSPSRRDGEGLSLTLQPSFGVTDTKLDELWSLSSDNDPAISNDRPGARMDAQLAYGFPLGNALFTPYTELAWEETTSNYGAGLRYGLNASLELDLKGAHHRRANGNDENRFSLDMRSQL